MTTRAEAAGWEAGSQVRVVGLRIRTDAAANAVVDLLRSEACREAVDAKFVDDDFEPDTRMVLHAAVAWLTEEVE